MKKIISMTLAIVLCLTLFTSTVLAEAGNKLEPGAGITFGHYEQDNDLANGAEPIEWVVLEVSGNKALLISHYGLDAKPYNTDYIDTTWETCSLRAWLNSDFLNTAFTAEEQTAILTSEHSSSSAAECSAILKMRPRRTKSPARPLLWHGPSGCSLGTSS